jgi:hypothetical protein
MTLSGLEPVTFWLVAKHLRHYATMCNGCYLKSDYVIERLMVNATVLFHCLS